MIYFKKENIILITPPHTASGNLHRYFCSPEQGAIWINGPDPVTKIIDHHYASIHIGWTHTSSIDGKNLNIVLITRNPYSRLYGLFLHYNFWLENELKKAPVTFDNFLLHRPKHWIYTRSIVRHMQLSPKASYNSYIKYENLEEELSKLLNREVNLPPKYHDFVDIKEIYNSQTRLNQSKQFVMADLKRFNYDEIKLC